MVRSFGCCGVFEMIGREKRISLFSRGSFQQLTFLVLLSPLFVNSLYNGNKTLFMWLVILVTFSNIGLEFFLTKKRGGNPKEYIGIFTVVSIPINMVILLLFST